MTDHLLKKPKELINQAVSAIKGPDVETLVEEFTGEMTLVAEGLCEDQQRLRREMEALRANQRAAREDGAAEVEKLLYRMSQWERETDDRLKALASRLDQLEKKQTKQKPANPLMKQATVLAVIVCASWVLVTLLNLLKTLIPG